VIGEPPRLDNSRMEWKTVSRDPYTVAYHGEKAMRTIALFSALALGALTSAALAEEQITLTDSQMDKITAGAGQTGNVYLPEQGASHSRAGQNYTAGGCSAGQGCQEYIHLNPAGFGNFPTARNQHSRGGD
jgi:hypothetical protein